MKDTRLRHLERAKGKGFTLHDDTKESYCTGGNLRRAGLWFPSPLALPIIVTEFGFDRDRDIFIEGKDDLIEAHCNLASFSADQEAQIDFFL